MGWFDFKAVSSRAKKKTNKAYETNIGSNVGRLTNTQVAGLTELHVLEHDNILFAFNLATGLQ